MVLNMLLLSLLFAFYTAVSGQTDAVSITAFTSYDALRPCAASSCIQWKIDELSVYVLATALSCNIPVLSKPENNCFCRTDLMSSAATWLASCVSSFCSGDTNDITSATSVYLAYCSQAGYVPASAPAETTPSTIATSTSANTAIGSSSPAATAAAPTSESTSESTSTSGNVNSNNGDSSSSGGNANSSSGGGSSSGGLTPGIDTGVAIASLVVAVAAVWIGWMSYKWMKKSKST